MKMTIRKGTPADTEGFIRLLEEVREGMDHKEWFYLDPPELVREMIEQGKMLLWVAMNGRHLAGALSIVIPGEESDNYGYDLGFSREERSRVVNMDTAAVSPAYRGQGLQGRLLEEAESWLRQEGQRILLCTVHPDNQFSLKNVLKQGYSIQKRLEKYGSVRYILRKDLF